MIPSHPQTASRPKKAAILTAAAAAALRLATRRRFATTAAIACVAAGAPVGALAASAPQTAAAAQCTNAHTYVWLALAPEATAPTIYYPVEFTNIGHTTCTLYGYPGVSAVSAKLKQLGPAAERVTATRHTVTLKPGQTANAILGVAPPSVFAGCHTRAADGLKVYPPNETGKQYVAWFSFPACSNKSVLTIRPVTKGIDVP
jgi:hypothetical protein